jgi:hypothetical protein
VGALLPPDRKVGFFFIQNELGLYS